MGLSSYIHEVHNQAQTKHQKAHLESKIKELLMHRLGFDAIMRIIQDDKVQARKNLQIIIHEILHELQLDKEASYTTAITQRIIDSILGYGPLELMLHDESVTEIMVNGCHSVFYEREGILHESSSIFDNEQEIYGVIDKILAPIGRRVDEQSPLVNARLPYGYRVNIVIPPLSLVGPVLTIRKFSNHVITLDELIEKNSLPAWLKTFLCWAIKARKNIAVAGGTGSGKTTLLNALSCEIPHHERIITIEDSAELQFLSHPHVVRLEKREASIEGKGEITIRDLVINALRMRPDRIIVGECRGAETIDMLQAMNTGHDGSLTTLHAGNAQEALARLALMSKYGIDLPAAIIEDQIASALDLIIIQSRLPRGKRALTHIAEVFKNEKGEISTTDVLKFDPVCHEWSLNYIPQFINSLPDLHIATHKEVQTWSTSIPLSLSAR